MSLSATRESAPRRGARAYFVASGVSQVTALARYVLLARMLGPKELGLAATLILTGVFFDLIAETAADRFLIQDKDGDLPAVQELVQFVFVWRGAAIAVALAVFAWPIAAFYNAPELAPAMAALGLSPFLAGFIHLDMRRVQRVNDFTVESISSTASEIAGLVGTVLAAYLTHRFTAVIYGLVARSLVLVLCSHFFAKRRYAIKYSHEHGPRLGRFSGPLIANGLVLFLAGQGDRVIVGRRISFAALGHYSAILLLIYYPAYVVRKYMEGLYLPLIAAERSNDSARESVTSALGSQTLLLALGMTSGFALVTPTVVGLLYGRSFSEAAPVVALIGILQSSRFLIIWPTTVALAMARSGIVLASNILRLIAWPAAFIGVALTGDLSGVVIGFILGELLSFVIALIMLNRSEKKATLHNFGKVATSIGAFACVYGWACASARPTLPAVSGLALASALLIIWIARSEMSTLRQLIALSSRFVRRGA